MVGGGPFQLQPGQWTDDTSMALCLAESLIERRRLRPGRPARALRALVPRRPPEQHRRAASTSATPSASALRAFERTGEPVLRLDRPRARPATARSCGWRRCRSFFARDPGEAIARAGDSSRTTHGASDGGRRLPLPRRADRRRGAGGDEGGAAGAALYARARASGTRSPSPPKIDAVAAGSFNAPRAAGDPRRRLRRRTRSRRRCGPSITRARSRRAACWPSTSATTPTPPAAVYGQLAGAFYGADGIPAEWRARLAQRALIEDYADQLYALAGDA